MKLLDKLAVVMVVVAAASAGVAPAAQGSDAAGREDVVTPAGYAYRPNFDGFYPSASRVLREEGSPRVRACYDTKGKVQSAEIDESSGFERLDEAAIRAGHEFVIKPGTINGVPVEGCVRFRVNFSLLMPGDPSPDNRARNEGGSSSTELTFMPDIRSYYPSASRKKREEGTVTIKLCYDAKGKIVGTEVHNSSGFEQLDAAAVRAGSKIRLKPAEKDGQPQAGCGLVPIKFTLAR